MRLSLRLSLTVALGISAAYACSQDLIFLVPQAFVTSKSTVEVSLQTAQRTVLSGKDLPVRWAFVKTGLVQENRDDLTGWLDTGGTFQCPVPGPGAVMVGVDFAPTLEVLPRNSVKALAEPGTLILGSTVKVRHYRSALTLFRSPQDDPGSTIATTEVSLAASIHPLIDPTRFQLGGEMPYELVLRGEEIEKAPVSVFSVTSGRTLTIATTEGGLGVFKPTEPGEHRLSYQYARPIKNDPDAQFEVFSTTLVFNIERGQAR